MNRIIVLSMAAVVGAGTAGSVFFGNPPVELQPSTPGVAQTGHLNISGTAIVGTLQAQSVIGTSSVATGAVSGGSFSSLSSSGRGVTGRATSSGGTTTGGYFESTSSTGRGVYGLASSPFGSVAGGRFETPSTSGIGVFAYVNAATGSTKAVYATSTSTTGYGVYGTATATTGANFGGYFSSSSDSGTAIYARALSATGSTIGGRFESSSSAGTGLVASSVNVGARATSSGTAATTYGLIGNRSSGANASGYGVYGIHPGGGFAVYASGKLGATGTKSFRIDHPEDPENKYLLHYSAEGPDVLNIYSGNVVTDNQGFATIKLPSYFGDINRDPRYTLTVIDDGNDFVMAKVVRKVQDNQFTIRTSKGNVEVSWEVKGIRNDRFVQTYGAPTEVEKGSMAGTYLQPELYGKGVERREDYEAIKEDLPKSQGQRSSAPQRSR